MTTQFIPKSPPTYFLTLTKLAVPFFAILTILFLVLPGVTGPQTGVFWLRVEYKNQTDTLDSGTNVNSNTSGIGNISVNGSVNNAGEMWNLGGLGSCIVGQQCQKGQISSMYSKPVQQVLELHLAAYTYAPLATALFFISACFSLILFKCPQAPISKKWSTVIPVSGPIITAIISIANICIAHITEVERGVEKVDRIGVFWLGTVSFVFSIIWFILAELDGMYIRYNDAENNKPKPEETDSEKGLGEKAVEGVIGLWPWKGQEKRGTSSSREKSSEGERKESRKSKSRSKSRRKGPHSRKKSEKI